MKRSILAVLLFFAFAHFVKAQTYDTSQIQAYLQYMMQSVDKSQISTGYLEEYGLPALSMEPFDGTANPANWSEPNLWRLLYFQLYTSYTGAGDNPLPTISS